ncbi:MAG: NifB/NifX family molybdenum-iron cluster-binding protein [Geovibrio sp.]|uniref:NifB/NifX family molybdenum-iron cluster-binding protein n=1 Tax=Geovibrio ferrireducens TaxID=46201 RepID=UPI0022480A5A|nr:NifB/NifX family molybdenum-iron cluster-binding protein [Geovibrio ferrireducens]MCD8490402.1 NifB/NifX family molybdenum-iron cluster-binding protein [Geovibrio sp.]MCD8569648.1 NifB/NifX family molybdenum-iron cluster-binding protein [Geovibrio sp.]
MKICFPISHDNGLESRVYGHFGSAPAFIVADSETNTVSMVNNADLEHVHGACNPALALAGKSIDAVVVGGIGAGAIAKLNSLRTKVYQAKGITVQENLDAFRNGTLTELGSASCSGHEGGHSCGHSH